MKTIKSIPRKVIRYLMFAEKNGTKIETPILSKRKDRDVIKFYEKHPEFTSWQDFEVHWDVGMSDEILTQLNRPEKWFLFDADKTEIVKRPSDYWDQEAKRRKTTTQALFMQECHQRGIELEEFFKIFFKSTTLDAGTLKH